MDRRPVVIRKSKTRIRAFFLLFEFIFLLTPKVFSDNFTFNASSGRVITPNGDGKNDFFIVSFFNPQFSSVTGKIYDLKGHLVAEMSPASSPTCPSLPTLQCLMWNGTSNGRTVLGGIYVYVLSSGGEVYDGTVVVIR